MATMDKHIDVTVKDRRSINPGDFRHNDFITIFVKLILTFSIKVNANFSKRHLFNTGVFLLIAKTRI